MTMSSSGRSRSSELIGEYLLHASSGRAWYLCRKGAANAKRWHAKCRTSSDYAVVRHKSRADSDECLCGRAAEDAMHTYLDCPIHERFREPLRKSIRGFCEAVFAENLDLDDKGAMAWVHTNSPVLLQPESVVAGEALRAAALKFYAQARVERYVAGKRAAGQLVNPVPPLQNDGEFPALSRPQGKPHNDPPDGGQPPASLDPALIGAVLPQKGSSRY